MLSPVKRHIRRHKKSELPQSSDKGQKSMGRDDETKKLEASSTPTADQTKQMVRKVNGFSSGTSVAVF